MKKRLDWSKLKLVLITVAAVLFVLFVFFPLVFYFAGNPQGGNVALIPIEGVIGGDGQSFGSSAVSSKDIVGFIEDADNNAEVKVLLLEIDSPGGSAVASDEIAAAVKKMKKPVVALIRESGASGAYWIASAADHIIANRMSITGSIGVISSYLEFSGLMEKYGVGYQQLISGQYKDLGSPYKKLTGQEKNILQKKLDLIHVFFIEEVAANRNLEISKVQKIATGEFFLGEEALQLGLVDQLGGEDEAEAYIKQQYDLPEIDYIMYQPEPGLLDLLSQVLSSFSFSMGEGIGSMFTQEQLGVSLR